MKSTGLNAHTLTVPSAFGDGENRDFAMGESGLQVSTDDGASVSIVPDSPLSRPAAMLPASDSGQAADDRIFIGEAPVGKYDIDDRSKTPLGYAGLTATRVGLPLSSDSAAEKRAVVGGEAVTPQGPEIGSQSEGRCVRYCR